MSNRKHEAGSEPVVCIAFDAAEISLVERLCAQGRMPNLQALKRRGASARLTHSHGGLQASVWRTFTTGRYVTQHGCYFPKMWKPEAMRVDFIDKDWPEAIPFWALPTENKPRVALIDIPYLLDVGPDFDGIAINNWQVHDPQLDIRFPHSIEADWIERFGRKQLPDQDYGPQNLRTFERAYQTCLQSADQIADIASFLLENDRFDFFLLALGQAHRGGHLFWDLSQIDDDALNDDQRAKYHGALVSIYERCDEALGKILSAAPENSRIIVMALHGMGPHRGWNEFFQPLFDLATCAEEQAPNGHGLLGRLNRFKESRAVRALTIHVPPNIQKPLTRFWTKRMQSWSSTQVFWVPSDVEGYIRLNLKGREPEGIVEPGAEARAILDDVAEGFMGLRDLETAAPLVHRVEFIDDLETPVAGPRNNLPDLLIHWGDVSQGQSRGVRNAHGQERHWPMGRKNLSGRSGNHQPDGWAVMVSDDMPKGVDLGSLASIDLTPTIAQWLGLDVQDQLEGQPLTHAMEFS